MDETAALKQLNRWAGESFPMNASAWDRGRLYLRLAGAKAAVARALEGPGGRELEPQAATAWWSDIRDHRHEFFSLSDAQLERGECSWRLAVPDSAPPIDLPGEQLIEWGGGQRWWRSAAPASQIRSAAERAGRPGVFTALKAPSMNIHKRLKQSFDPAGIFNPGRLYPEL